LGDRFDLLACLLLDPSEYSIFCPIGVDLFEGGSFSVLFSFEESLPDPFDELLSSEEALAEDFVLDECLLSGPDRALDDRPFGLGRYLRRIQREPGRSGRIRPSSAA